MKQDNIIDFVYYSQAEHIASKHEKNMSDELQKAIQKLIDRLKEVGPLYSV